MLEYSKRNKKTLKGLRGFSLVELLIVIFIISVTAAVVIVPYGDDRDKKELEASSREFLGAIREAQNYALTGKQLLGDSTPCGFTVDWSGSSTSYRLLYYYRSVGDSACQPMKASYTISPMEDNPSSTVYTKELRGRATFTSASSISFSLPHAAPHPTPGPSNPLPIILEQGTAFHVVCLYEKGQLSDHSGGSCPSI